MLSVSATHVRWQVFIYLTVYLKCVVLAVFLNVALDRLNEYVAMVAITVCCHKNVITSGPDPLRMWLLGSNLNRFLVCLNIPSSDPRSAHSRCIIQVKNNPTGFLI